MAEQVQAAFGDGSAFGVRIEYSLDGEKLLGTGGALKRAERFFTPAAFVVNGDTYIDIDLAQLARVHSSARHEWGAVATLTLTRVSDAQRFGAVEFDSEDRVTRFCEKDSASSQEKWVNAGVYVIERALIDRIPTEEVVSLERDVFPAALYDGLTLAAFTHDRPFHDIGTPDDFRAFLRKQEAAHAA